MMHSSAKRTRTLTMVFMILAMAVIGTAHGFVVSKYKINGQFVYDGMSYQEVRAIAGDPISESVIKPNDQLVEWTYQCARPGNGPCTVVAEGGKRRMRALFTLGRLTGITFEDL